MQAQGQFITLRDGAEAKAVIAPDLGGWLLQYQRHLPERGYVNGLYFSQEVVDRYPNQMYAGNPILFPQVSYTHWAGREHHYPWQGKVYALPQHGFARREKWRVISVNETEVSMELSDTPATQTAYPFRFHAQVKYSLRSGNLRFEQLVENRDERVLPFSTGIHPYFPVPVVSGGRRNDCYVELPDARQVRPDKDWQSWTAEPFPAQRLPVSRDVADTLLLTDLKEARVALVDPNARVRITLDFREAPQHRFLAIWSKSPEEPFYCLEPWTALPNSFARKETELVLLRPGEQFRAAMEFRIEAL